MTTDGDGFPPPLAGVRVLSMEQAAALPFATRHLADLGADVIRVESHTRARAVGDPDLFRNKRRLALDLGAEGGPEAFLRVAAGCDIVAHNFTPRVMRRYGIDYEGVRAVNENVIYVSLTGFGTTGPWGERPLFGPGAEAVSGHNMLIGDPDAWPGRPGTIVYADNTCGLNCAFAMLAALEQRDRTGRGQHIDISLYETAAGHLGPAVAARAFGAPLPERVANADAGYALHGVFAAAGHDRYVAISAHEQQLPAVAAALGLEVVTDGAVATAVAGREAEQAVAALVAAGVAASVVADASDHTGDEHLWSRGYFGALDGVPGVEGERPHAGPPWGTAVPHERRPMRPPHGVGADSRDVLREIGGLSEAEIDDLHAAGVTGELPPPVPAARADAARNALRIERGELSRVDDEPDGWRAARDAVGRS